MQSNVRIEHTGEEVMESVNVLGAMEPVFNMTRPTKTNAYINTTKKLRRYMADYTNTKNIPGGVKSGWYAIVTKVTGKVWLSKTKNLQTTLNRYRTTTYIPMELKSLVDEGFAIFLTSKDIDIDQLRFELDESNCLLQSSVGNKSTVRLCAVVHPTGYYYLTNVQVDTFNPKVIVNRFVNRVLDLKHSSGQKSNDKLHEFVSVNAGDLLREKGFEVCELGDFKTTEEVIKVVDNYHSKQADKICLNHVFNNH